LIDLDWLGDGTEAQDGLDGSSTVLRDPSESHSIPQTHCIFVLNGGSLGKCELVQESLVQFSVVVGDLGVSDQKGTPECPASGVLNEIKGPRDILAGVFAVEVEAAAHVVDVEVISEIDSRWGEAVDLDRPIGADLPEVLDRENILDMVSTNQVGFAPDLPRSIRFVMTCSAELLNEWL